MKLAKGFTLIELLVVIAIIALLAAILFPVFAQAREKARATACLSNLKQIGLAYTQYEEDYDETVPAGLDAYGGGPGWAGMIYPYVKSQAVFLCPDDTIAGDVISYAENANMVGYVPSGTGVAPLPAQISQMTAPTRTVLLFEVVNCGGFTIGIGEKNSPEGLGIDSMSSNSLYANMNSGTTSATTIKYATGVLANAYATGDGTNSANPASITGSNSYFMAQYGRHQNGANYLMADDHAKWFIPTAVGGGKDFMNDGAMQPGLCPPSMNGRAPTTWCNQDDNGNPFTYGATFSLL